MSWHIHVIWLICILCVSAFYRFRICCSTISSLHSIPFHLLGMQGAAPQSRPSFSAKTAGSPMPNGKDPKNFKRFQSISSLDWDDPSFGPKTGWIFPTSPTWGLSNPLITIPSTEIIHVPAPEKSGWSISSFFPGMENQKNYYQTRKWFTMKVGNPEKQNIICIYIYIICMPTIFQKVRPNHWTMKQLDSGGLIRRSRLSLFSCEAGEGSKITEDGQQKHRATPRQWRKSGEMMRKLAEMDSPPKRFMGAMMIDHLSLGYVWTNPEKNGEMTVQM